MTTIYHSAFGGDLVFETNDSLEHASNPSGYKKAAERAAENRAKELVKDYVSTIRETNEEFQNALEKHIKNLEDNPQKLIDYFNQYKKAFVHIEAQYEGSPVGSGTAAVKSYTVPDRLKQK